MLWRILDIKDRGKYKTMHGTWSSFKVFFSIYEQNGCGHISQRNPWRERLLSGEDGGERKKKRWTMVRCKRSSKTKRKARGKIRVDAEGITSNKVREKAIVQYMRKQDAWIYVRKYKVKASQRQQIKLNQKDKKLKRQQGAKWVKRQERGKRKCKTGGTRKWMIFFESGLNWEFFEEVKYKESTVWKRWLCFNPFHATGFFLYCLKTFENLWFSAVFRGFRKGSLA